MLPQLIVDDGRDDNVPPQPKPQNLLVHFFGTYDKTWVENVKKAGVFLWPQHGCVLLRAAVPVLFRPVNGGSLLTHTNTIRACQVHHYEEYYDTYSGKTKQKVTPAPTHPSGLLRIHGTRPHRTARGSNSRPLSQNFLTAMEEAKAYIQTGELPKRMTGEFDPLSDDTKQTRVRGLTTERSAASPR